MEQKPGFNREGSLSFTQSLQQAKKPSLLPSTSFRAATQLPRYCFFLVSLFLFFFLFSLYSFLALF